MKKNIILFIGVLFMLVACDSNNKKVNNQTSPYNHNNSVPNVPQRNADYYQKQLEQQKLKRLLEQQKYSNPQKRKTDSFTPDDAYDEGYDMGYEQGYEDGKKGCNECNYDESSSYYNYYETKYIEGYASGYEEGYSDGYRRYEDEDNEDEDEDNEDEDDEDEDDEE
jgi:flagellar biosynthesis/type III secretory pathway protein FliH